MTETSIPSATADIKSLSGHTANRRRAVSIFAGWWFMRFREAEDDEAFPLMANFSFTYPTIEFHPSEYTMESLENPMNAGLWLPPTIGFFCNRVLAEAMADTENRIGSLVGKGWDGFREEILRQCDYTMEELVRAAHVNGFHNAVMYMTQCMYFESGIHGAIAARKTGRAILRSA